MGIRKTTFGEKVKTDHPLNHEDRELLKRAKKIKALSDGIC